MGAMLAEYEKHQSKPKTTAELKTVLMTIWDNLPQQSIDKVVVFFRKRRHVLELSVGILIMASYKTKLTQF